MKELGVFCGTFNPIHWGHLLIAELAIDQFKLEKVLFITSPSPPHKSDDLLEGEYRHKLVEAAVYENINFETSRIELERIGPSYTVETIKIVQEELGKQVNLNLIVGEDNLVCMNDWHNAELLFKTCKIIVAPRAYKAQNNDACLNNKPSNLPNYAQVNRIDFPQIPVSSSLIRQRLREGKSVLYLVPPKVNDLLIKNRYYTSQV